MKLPIVYCSDCHTKCEWKPVKSVKWARPHKQPSGLQVFCPKCGKMKKGRLYLNMRER